MARCGHELCEAFNGLLDEVKALLGIGRRGSVGATAQYGQAISEIDWTNGGTRQPEVQCLPLPWIDKLGTTKDPRFDRL